MSKTCFAWFVLIGTLVSCQDDPAKLQDPTQGRMFPSKLVLIYSHADFMAVRDTLWYEYAYEDGRITSITIQRERWRVAISCSPCPQHLESSNEVMEFSYIDNQILINVLTNGNRLASYSFDFDNDQLVYPSRFKMSDSNGMALVDGQFSYDEEGFLTHYTLNGQDVELTAESGNILLPYDDGTGSIAQSIEYSQNQSPINQFAGFSYFIYNAAEGRGIDPVSLAFNWFRPSKDLIASHGSFSKAKYAYEYSNGQLSSIRCVCNCADAVSWNATIEY